MCLGVPGKLIRWIERDGPFASADVEFAGVRRVCHMACVSEAQEGQFVLIHAGVAISVIDEAEAQWLIDELLRLTDAGEWSRNGHFASSGPRAKATGDSS